MDAAPQARLVTTLAGMGILSCEGDLPVHRIQLLNPGERLDIGDRALTAYRPPLFDSPVTVGFQESRSGAFFASDWLGGAMPTSDLVSGPDLDDIPDDDRRAAQLLRAGVDSPWVRLVDREACGRVVDEIGPRQSRCGSHALMSEDGPERDRIAGRRAAELDLREAALAAREAALAEREATLTVREKALAERMGATQQILDAADQRDAVSDSREIGGETREQHLDRAHFPATGDTYRDDLPLCRGAALDRGPAATTNSMSQPRT